MKMHEIVKVLASTGIAASVVTGASAVSNNNEVNAAETEAETQDSYYYNYEGDTGYDDGSFLLDENFKKTLIHDGEMNFNGYNIEASANDYKEHASKADSVEEVSAYDQKFTVYDGGTTATHMSFPIQEGQLSIEDVIAVYGDNYEVEPGNDGAYDTYVYQLGDDPADLDYANTNKLALKVEDGYVTEGMLGIDNPNLEQSE